MAYIYYNMLIFITLFSAAGYGHSNDNKESEKYFDTSAVMNTSDSRNTQIQIPHQVHTISFIGAGLGHVSNTAFKKVSINFFISHLWEVLSRCAVGIGGEYTTDINAASLAVITGIIDLYPFKYGTTPYLGIETGVGYVQIPGQTDFGMTLSGETGVLAIKVSTLLIGVSARLTFYKIRISEDHPVEILLKVGILL